MRNLKIIKQTLFNNLDGKAVYADQVYDRSANKFQSDINKAGGSGTSQEILDALKDIDARLKKIEDNVIIPDE